MSKSIEDIPEATFWLAVLFHALKLPHYPDVDPVESIHAARRFMGVAQREGLVVVDNGECESCVDGKCTTGPKCVTLGRDT